MKKNIQLIIFMTFSLVLLNCKKTISQTHKHTENTSALFCVLAEAEDGTFKFGSIDKTGKIIIKPQFDDVRDFNNGLARVKFFSGKIGYIDKIGKIIW